MLMISVCFNVLNVCFLTCDQVSFIGKMRVCTLLGSSFFSVCIFNMENNLRRSMLELQFKFRRGILMYYSYGSSRAINVKQR